MLRELSFYIMGDVHLTRMVQGSSCLKVVGKIEKLEGD